MGFGTPTKITRLYTTKEIKLYPPGALPVQAFSSATPFEYGSWSEIVPADTITSDFIVVAVPRSFVDPDPSELVAVQIGVGAVGEEEPIITVFYAHMYASGVGFALSSEEGTLPIPRKVVANSRVAVRVADTGGVVRAYAVKIMYIELPL